MLAMSPMSPSPPVSAYTSTSPATSTGSPASAPEPSAPSAASRMAVVLALDSATLGWSNGLIRSARPATAVAYSQSRNCAPSVSGPLGAQFLLWEYATAVAGRALRINPFDQPNVAESKANTTAILDAADGADGSGALAGEPVLVAGDVEVYDDTGGLGDIADIADIADLTAVFDALLGAVPPEGYLAILAYLDRGADAAAAELRPLLAARLAHPVTFGWGPRFLHSTGQYHKGGPQVGAFL